jgi:uncharacterized surface protein with fasciclin (FAS1) repeats
MPPRFARLTAGALAAGLLLVACGDDDADDAQESGTTLEESTTTEAPTDDAAEEGDIVETAMAAGDFTTLVAAVEAAGLVETLQGEGPFTVFAPTDDAFAALPAGTLDDLLADPTGDLTSILTYHVVEGEVPAADVVGLDGQDVTTVNGATFTVEVGDDGSVSLVDATGATVGVVQTDVEASNGVIHVIDGVLLPG